MRSSPSGRPDARWLTAQPYAHRGLHGPGVPENSRAAFAAAIARGHGIELDVQASLRGFAFVFHDESLDRLTGESGPLALRDAEELERIRLKGSDETIPTLDDVLDLVGGRMPVLIEVKARARYYDQLCFSVANSLCRYRGPAAVMSFDPRVGGWFARRFPQFVRGLVVSEQGKGRAKGWLERAYSLWRAKPDFLAYDLRDLPSPFSVRQRARGLPVLTWTCRGDADRARAARHADQIIYEDL